MGNCSGRSAVSSNRNSGKATPPTSVDGSKVPPAFISPERSKTVPFNANPGGKILMKAIRRHNWNQIEYCMNNEIGKYYRDPTHGFTPLHQFIFHQAYATAPTKEIYERFLQFQSHCVNVGDERQATPLHFAIWYVEPQNFYVSFDLMNYGADRTLKDSEGISPAEYAENEAFQKRKASFVVENYDSSSSLSDLITKSASNDEGLMGEESRSSKKVSAKLSLSIATEDISPTFD